MNEGAKTFTPAASKEYRVPRAGDIVVVEKDTANEAVYVFIPHTMEHWVHVLQVKGPNLKPGEVFHRSAPLLRNVLGTLNFGFLDRQEFRMRVVDGKIVGMLMPKEAE